MKQLNLNLPYSAACERNQEPIYQVIKPYLENAKTVLEIGSGTAQHAVFFASKFPQLIWQTADRLEYHAGIHAQLDAAHVSNVLLPIELDVNHADWNTDGKKYDVVFSANTLHIMSNKEVNAFFEGLANVSHDQTILLIYGPFTYEGAFTSESNLRFDENLRSRGVGSCIKAFEEIQRLTAGQGFSLSLDQAMPANNQCLVFQRS